ncbi:MAG TPA: helix-hairpin-helix domain-containing protein [Patescibacteria group bacterium]|nr:helix-hairpin-helix domain-containing protein [Patescibacteria group bacterium]
MDPAQDESENIFAGIWRLYKLPILLGVVSLVCIGISLVLLVKSTQNDQPIEFTHDGGSQNTSNQASGSANLKLITLDIEGAVVHPGVTMVPVDARVEDAIIAAGGMLSNADTDYVAKNINRAMKVSDGMKIYIPTVDETSHNGDSYERLNETSYNLSNSSNGQSQNTALISVNMASKDELDSLPGVGPITAQKIIDNRPYGSLDDLVAKKAIGPSLLEKLKNSLSL